MNRQIDTMNIVSHYYKNLFFVHSKIVDIDYSFKQTKHDLTLSVIEHLAQIQYLK
jgi:hypothetical protein